MSARYVVERSDIAHPKRPWVVWRLEPFGLVWGLRDRFARVAVSNGFRTRREASAWAAHLERGAPCPDQA